MQIDCLVCAAHCAGRDETARLHASCRRHSGDTLNSNIADLTNIRGALREASTEVTDCIEHVLERLCGLQSAYERGCGAAGLALPYPKPE